MLKLYKKGFTLIEIITVVVIIGTLATALYIGTMPYMKRSRDAKRITDVTSYMSIIDAYDKNFETYPSNYGSGSTTSTGYCLSEMYTRPDYVGFKDMKFTALTSETSVPPRDPSNSPSIEPCIMTGSYLYSRLDYGTSNQLALIAVRLEMKSSANYATGADLIDPTKVDVIKAAKKGTVPDNATDGLFVIYRMR